jgi:protocatechuate 4,5-dioxygenase beta chain
MPIGLGLASSHAPAVAAPVDQWPALYSRFISKVPQPPTAAAETEEVRREHFHRIHRAFDVLQERLSAYQPELLIMIGGDQSEMFDASNVPNLMLYVGEEAWAEVGGGGLMGGQAQEPDVLRLRIDAETSRWLLHKLVCEEEFDVAVSSEQQHLGPRGRGLPHAFYRPVPFLTPNADVPLVLLYENTYDPPSLSARRCYDLGRALARLLADDPRRIAIYGSGGLSHDPGGPRAGWIDVPLDQWFLGQIEKGNGIGTTAMYSFDSMTMRGGTGEMRAWITVAGAMEEMGSRAVVVDYIPSHHAVTGLGWAYWDGSSFEASQRPGQKSASS